MKRPAEARVEDYLTWVNDCEPLKGLGLTPAHWHAVCAAAAAALRLS